MNFGLTYCQNVYMKDVVYVYFLICDYGISRGAVLLLMIGSNVQVYIITDVSPW